MSGATRYIGIALAREFAPAHPVARDVAAALRRRLRLRQRKLQLRPEQVRTTRLSRIMRTWSVASGRAPARGKASGDMSGEARARRAIGRLAAARKRVDRALATVAPGGNPGALHRLRNEVKHARYMADALATQRAEVGRGPADRRLADWQRELAAIADLRAFDAVVERYARDDPTRAVDGGRLRTALAERQRQLARSLLRRHRRSA